MADYAIPKAGVAYIFYTGLVSQADTKLLKSAPTLAAGDFKVSIDGGAFANLTTLPTNTPSGTSVKISLSAAEMTGDNILVACIDAAGAEWCDQIISIQTAPRGVADLAYPTVSGRSLDVSAGGEAGLDWANIGSPTTANNLSATNIDVDQVVASVSGAVGSVIAAVTLPTIPTGWITADGIAADAIGSSELAASAITEIQAGLSTLTQTQVTGGAYALNSASFSFNTAMDFTTTQKAATLARVTLVDTTTTNSDMRGTDSAALAATALSTTQWTNTLATNLGTTNTSVAAILIDTGTDIPASITAESVKTAAIKVKTDQMVFTTPNRVDASATVSIAAADIRAALGMSAADLDSQLDAILAAASASAGSGARTVTITVNDGATVLENAIVRMTEGVNSFRALTNVSGVAVFNLDDATYTVSITKAGYTYAGTTIIVNGTETATYSMSVVAVAAPASPSKTAIEVLCLDEDDDPVAGIDIDMRRVVIPVSGTNTAYLGTKVTVTSNVSGIARFEVAQGITVEYKRGTADVWTRLTVDSDSVTNVTSFIGSP